MPMPPDDNKIYFEFLCDKVNKYLDKKINFNGYDELINKYRNINLNDKNQNWELATELNIWAEYCSELTNYIQNQFLDSETEKLQIQSTESIKADVKNVSAGERISNTKIDVINARKKRNILKAVLDGLTARSNFLEKAFYQCKMALTIKDDTK